MTQVIDHAIQIPVSVQSVWSILSNLDDNPKWQLDCKSVAYLNSIRRGIGMRWRYKDASGKELVAEVTAWYDGLGFEYTLVDGVSFASNKGRLRLQEVPEGTVVQWTFSYEMPGVWGGLRNSLGLRGKLDTNIVESLRNLFRVCKGQFLEVDTTASRALMRDAPNVQERSSYKTRYRSVIEDGKPKPASLEAQFAPPAAAPGSQFQPTAIYEPPVAADDTRPNAAVASPSPAQTQEIAILNVQPPMQPALVDAANVVVQSATSEVPVEFLPIQNTNPLAIAPEPAPAAPMPSPVITAPTVSQSTEPLRPIMDFAALDKRDTATISVFELFGLPRPSETQTTAAVSVPPVELPAQTLAENVSAAIEPVPPVEVADVAATAPNPLEALSVIPAAPSLEEVLEAVPVDLPTATDNMDSAMVRISSHGIQLGEIVWINRKHGLRARLRQRIYRLRYRL